VGEADGHRIDLRAQGGEFSPCHPVPEPRRAVFADRALEKVPQNYRIVILLADVQEFSYKEIAEILQIPIGTVMSRLSRGRGIMREALSGAGIAAEFIAANRMKRGMPAAA
jgi:hypothetical protein